MYYLIDVSAGDADGMEQGVYKICNISSVIARNTIIVEDSFTGERHIASLHNVLDADESKDELVSRSIHLLM